MQCLQDQLVYFWIFYTTAILAKLVYFWMFCTTAILQFISGYFVVFSACKTICLFLNNLHYPIACRTSQIAFSQYVCQDSTNGLESGLVTFSNRCPPHAASTFTSGILARKGCVERICYTDQHTGSVLLLVYFGLIAGCYFPLTLFDLNFILMSFFNLFLFIIVHCLYWYFLCIFVYIFLEFIFFNFYFCNCLSLGWTNRHQFEESWMSLLGVLNPVSHAGQTPSPEVILLLLIVIYSLVCFGDILIKYSFVCDGVLVTFKLAIPRFVLVYYCPSCLLFLFSHINIWE